MRILCVAEKNSISKAVASILSGDTYQTRNTGNQYVKNYTFDFNFQQWGPSSVTMTAVSGHITTLDVTAANKHWEHPPPETLFTCPVRFVTPEDKQSIADNIASQARYCQALCIWTDCDREGEFIGSSIVDAAKKGNPRIQVKRAHFSNIEPAHIMQAVSRLGELDYKQVAAVAARMELDLRTGYAFTRFLTLGLRPLGGPLSGNTISYGSCQFPTLGFVVDRYFKVKSFVPEPFWSIKVSHTKDGITANFSWFRNRLFDRASVIILYERCLAAKRATVKKVQEKPTKKWKPLPLTTIEFQKVATRLLQMTGQQAMSVAENLYNKGFISYPRTETDRFDKGMDLQGLVRKQIPSDRWGRYANDLLNGAFQRPRDGRHDDKAHPPIHPVTFAAPTVLNDQERRVYEFVVRRFLACCSDDAKGMATDIEIEYGEERFNAHGIIVLERNYLDVYIYDKWSDSAELPKFTIGERFEPTEALMTEGKTAAPGYLTEADLIALMDANGIGTDATMAEHIQKIQEREYVCAVSRGNRGNRGNRGANEGDGDAPAGRGGRGGRRGRGGRGGGAADGGSRGSNSVKEFIPTRLGVALIQGFDRMEFDNSLGKPFLRKEFEAKMKAICEARTTKDAVVRETLRQYADVFSISQERFSVLKTACREYVFDQHGV
ncbi:DNA topoisomerase [Zalerion maritima]|uniref:DNA topoisomerase n=1 Tax=Zalerion maritima TaxID=339359 RepID=A0AAD5WRF7_9PEZI|nr:DNA topoisomerase [Zalerion maritima]